VRIWDVAAGYLTRQSLLGEHRELHGLYRIQCERLAGYARHPETLRWTGCLSGLRARHRQLVAEMALRGYVDRTPLPPRGARTRWPVTFIDAPARQFAILMGKYAGGAGGRIPLPRQPQELWAQHKYSALARDPQHYRDIGRRVARMRRGAALDGLALDLTLMLRQPPDPARAANAVAHMWGYVAGHGSVIEQRQARRSPRAMLAVTQALARRSGDPYLLSSTALSELAQWRI
jgi:hypothetical protein